MRLRNFRLGTLAIFALLLLTACDTTHESASISWGSCAEDSMVYKPAQAQCRTVEVPLDHDSSSRGTVNIFSFRYLSSSEKRKGQIWFLEGGPGGSGRLLARAMLQVAEYYPDFDVYSLDHRGVGGSTRFGCSGDNEFGDDWDRYQECYDEIYEKWAGDIEHFSTTSAARDLHTLISLSRQKGGKGVYLGNILRDLLAPAIFAALSGGHRRGHFGFDLHARGLLS